MKILLTLFLALSLNAAGFWTLTGLKKANIYIDNRLSFVKPETLQSIKEKVARTLKQNNILTDQQDSPTLMVTLEEMEGDDVFYVYIKLQLGEEVETFRKDKSATFAITFEATDFIEVDAQAMGKDILESMDFVLSQFSDLYQDDNE